jgi:hypothetical protein
MNVSIEWIGFTGIVFYYCLKYRDQLCEDHGGETLAVRLAEAQPESH